MMLFFYGRHGTDRNSFVGQGNKLVDQEAILFATLTTTINKKEIGQHLADRLL